MTADELELVEALMLDIAELKQFNEVVIGLLEGLADRLDGHDGSLAGLYKRFPTMGSTVNLGGLSDEERERMIERTRQDREYWGDKG